MDPAPLLLLTQGHAGDRLGARLAPALQARFPARRLVGMGGSAMEAQGVRLLARTDDVSAVGWTGLLPALPSILWTLNQAVVRSRNPLAACVIAIDVWQPLQFLHRRAPHLRGLPHVCYLPPGPNFTGLSRVHGAASRLFGAIITPFAHQARLFREAGGAVTLAAHAGLQACREEISPLPAGSRENLLALLPGSRALEIRHGLDVQYRAAQILTARHPGLTPIVCCAGEEVERVVARRYPGLQRSRSAWEILSRARLTIACSGTATLEAAVLGCPGVVTYHGSPLQRWEWQTFHMPRLARLRAEGIASPYIALPNILAGTELYPELVGVPAEVVADAALRMLAGDAVAQRAGLDRVTGSLAWDDAGSAVAEAVAALLTRE